jgi:tetratricopeptide (TPR) repeat protein
VIAARIDLLEADARNALRRCSVVGRIFWPEAVGIDEQEIEPLTRRGLVSPRPQTSLEGLREFAFKHALIRDVAYASLPRAERRTLHCRVAGWIQQVAPDRDVETAELTAYHYREAIAYGEEDPDVVRQAYDLLISTGEAALRRGAFGTARTQFEHARDLAGDNGSRARALIALAELEALGARWDPVMALLDEAEALVDPDDLPARSASLAIRSRVYWLNGRWEDAHDAANGAVAALADLPESTQLARALARLSQIEMLRNRHESIATAREAIAVAGRVGDPLAEVNARINVFTQLSAEGVQPDVDEVFQIVLDGAAAGLHEEATRAAVNLLWSALGFLPVDRIESFLAATAEHLTSPPVIRDYLELSLAEMLYVPAGRWADADAILAAIDSSSLSATSTLVWKPAVGGLALRRGDMAEADRVLRDLGPLAMASGEPQRIIPMAGVVLPWLHVSGRAGEVRRAGAEILEAVHDIWAAVLSADPILRALHAAGEHDLVAAVTESIERSTGGRPSARLGISLVAGRGLGALADGRADEAVGQLSAAASRLDELMFVYDAACLRLDLARALEQAGDSARAADTEREARAVLERLGCVNPF